MQRAFIIGCGYTGRALARRLLASKIEVAGTYRASAPRTKEEIEGLSLSPVDLLEDQSLDFHRAEASVVYYMISTLFRRYDEEKLPHLLVMDKALRALSSVRIEGLIYLSSTSVYGDHHGGWVDEQTPPTPGSPWGRMRVDLERRFLEHGKKLGIPASIVRLPEIYGPDRGPVSRLQRGHAVRFLQRVCNRIHIDDLVRALLRLGQQLDEPLLLAADSHPCTTREIYEYAAALMGLGPLTLEKDDEPDPNRLSLLRDSKRCRNDRLLRWLGEGLLYPSYREGIAQIVREGIG
jgi:nucleoside-diphosphate-sugar epimerase